MTGHGLSGHDDHGGERYKEGLAHPGSRVLCRVWPSVTDSETGVGTPAVQMLGMRRQNRVNNGSGTYMGCFSLHHGANFCEVV